MKKPLVTKKPIIGFIGQGWVGKNCADDFQNRGYKTVRYSLESPYNLNEKKIADCDFIFIAVPTPTTSKGFEIKNLQKVLPLVGKGKVAVIKSTVIMGTTRLLQKEFKHCTIVHSPEFLSKNTAAYDAANPERNIVGYVDGKSAPIAKKVLQILPKAPYDLVCSAEEAEFIKYAHNVNGYFQVVFANVLYDVAKAAKVDWSKPYEAFERDSMMLPRYLNPIHKSGRGAGGHCFIKDFEAFLGFVRKHLSDRKSLKFLEAVKEKNLELLVSSGKDLDCLAEVYGKNYGKK